MNRSADDFAKLVASWKLDIRKFAIEALGFRPSTTPRGTPRRLSNQQTIYLREFSRLAFSKLAITDGIPLKTELAKQYARLQGISTRSGKSIGKDTLLAIVALWAIVCLDPVKVALLAPSGSQLKNILWQEIKKWVYGIDEEGNQTCTIMDLLDITDDAIYFVDPYTKQRIETRKIFPKTVAVDKEGDAVTISGLHEKHLIVILDEASKIRDNVYEQLQNTLTDPFNIILLTFNPERLTGFARDTHKGQYAPMFIKLAFDLEKSDRLTPEGLSIFLESMITLYGSRDSEKYKIYVNGEFPSSDSYSFIPMTSIMAANERNIIPGYDRHPVVCGIDVGVINDNTTLVYRKGPNVVRIRIITPNEHKCNEERLVAIMANDIVRQKAHVVIVETNGIGHAILTYLRRALATRRHIFVKGINTSEASSDKEQYCALRDELWDKLRKRFVDNDIKLPNDKNLTEELAAAEKEDKDSLKGKTKVIGNQEFKRVIGRSPDTASGLVMAFAVDDMNFLQSGTDYDDYTETELFNTEESDSWLTG